MVNENLKTLWKFQELSVANTQLKTAEEQLKIFMRTLEESVYKVKGAEELPKEDLQKYHEMEQLLYQVKNFIQDQDDKIGRRKRSIGFDLEKLIGVDEE